MTGPQQDATPSPPPDDLVVRGSRVAYAGLPFSALFLVAWLLVRDSPTLDATDAQLIGYYTDPDRRRAVTIAGLYVIPLAGIAFIWFMGLRRRGTRDGPRRPHVGALVVLLSNVGVLLAAGSATLAHQRRARRRGPR